MRTHSSITTTNCLIQMTHADQRVGGVAGAQPGRSRKTPDPDFSQAVECRKLTKDFGRTCAVRDLSFTAPMGSVTGFVGANGAGKTTTMRLLLGLTAPTSGVALVGGRQLDREAHPRLLVGPVLDTPGVHPGQSGRSHLRIHAAGSGIPRSRVDDVLELVELDHAADRRCGSYSLGMRQRLSIATAMLADPPILIFDEPTKGLDPPGMVWLRTLVRDLADEGRGVFVSSHHLSELEAVADRVVMIHRGHLVADAPLGELLASGLSGAVGVVTAQADLLADLLGRAGGVVERRGRRGLRVVGLSARNIGRTASQSGVVLEQLTDERQDLEVVYRRLTQNDEAGAGS